MVYELTCSQNPPHSFPQHPLWLDSKLWSSAKVRVLCISCKPHKGPDTPWNTDTCLPQPQLHLSSGQVDGQDVGTGWEQDGITRLHLFKLICKLPVILNSWISFSFSIYLTLNPRATLMTSPNCWTLGPFSHHKSQMNPPSSSHTTKAKWTLLKERHERQGGREGKSKRRKPEKESKLGPLMWYQIATSHKCHSPPLLSYASIIPRNPHKHILVSSLLWQNVPLPVGQQ